MTDDPCHEPFPHHTWREPVACNDTPFVIGVYALMVRAPDRLVWNDVPEREQAVWRCLAHVIKTLEDADLSVRDVALMSTLTPPEVH